MGDQNEQEEYEYLKLQKERSQVMPSGDGAPTADPYAARLKQAVEDASPVLRGASMGGADEILGAVESPMGALKQAGSYLDWVNGTKTNPNDPDIVKYKAERDFQRDVDKQVRKDSPKSYLGGGVISALPAAAIAPVSGPAALGFAALQGAGAGFMGSDSDKPTQQALDTGIGAGAGMVGQVVGQNVVAPVIKGATNLVGGKVISPLSKYLGGKAERWAQSASQATPSEVGKFEKGYFRKALDNGWMRFTDNPTRYAKRLEGESSATGKKIGTNLADADVKGVVVKHGDVIDEGLNQAIELEKSSAKKRASRQVLEHLDDVNKTDLPASAAEQEGRDWQYHANYTDKNDTLAAKSMARAFKLPNEKAITAADPKLGADFSANKKLFGLLEEPTLSASRVAAKGAGNPLTLKDMAIMAGGHAAGIPPQVSYPLERVLLPRLPFMKAVAGDKLGKGVAAIPEFTGNTASQFIQQQAASPGNREHLKDLYEYLLDKHK